MLSCSKAGVCDMWGLCMCVRAGMHLEFAPRERKQWPSGVRDPCRRAQIDMHTRAGALRLAVVPPQAGKALSAAELAWGHDIVLTTFSHLSAVWTQRRRASPLLQVHWLRIILDEVRPNGA